MTAPCRGRYHCGNCDGCQRNALGVCRDCDASIAERQRVTPQTQRCVPCGIVQAHALEGIRKGVLKRERAERGACA